MRTNAQHSPHPETRAALQKASQEFLFQTSSQKKEGRFRHLESARKMPNMLASATQYMLQNQKSNCSVHSTPSASCCQVALKSLSQTRVKCLSRMAEPTQPLPTATGLTLSPVAGSSPVAHLPQHCVLAALGSADDTPAPSHSLPGQRALGPRACSHAGLTH